MIEWLISFGNGCHYITMAFLLLYLLWLVRESFRTRKSGVVREEIMCSDDAGKCFLALWLAAEYLMRENFPFSLYPHYTAWKYWIAWPLLILCVIMEKSIQHKKQNAYLQAKSICNFCCVPHGLESEGSAYPARSAA